MAVKLLYVDCFFLLTTSKSYKQLIDNGLSYLTLTPKPCLFVLQNNEIVELAATWLPFHFRVTRCA